MITSHQNPKLKLVRSLMGRPGGRQEERAFIAEGVRLVEEALAANWPFRFVLIGETLSRRGQALAQLLSAHSIEVEMVPDGLLNQVSETATSQGILAVLNRNLLPLPGSLDRVLIPDSIRDPGNLGSLIRTAAAADMQAVLLPPETTDAFSPKVVRAGMGAHFRIPIHPLTWQEIRTATQLLNVYLADMDGRPCWQTDFRLPLALIVGGEAEGATADARRLAGARVKIPMPGKAESLNAGVAGAILMFEMVRQRSTP